MKALSYGAILWDVIEDQEYLGGALLNLCAHLALLGAESHIVSAVGQDDRGHRFEHEAQKLNICTDFVSTDSIHATGYVDVTVDKKGQPVYRIHENVAYDFITLKDTEIQELAKMGFDLFCFGTFEQRSDKTSKTLWALLDCLSIPLVFYDVNFRQHYYTKDQVERSLIRAHIAKLNEEEAGEISRLMRFGEGVDHEALCRNLSEKYDLSVVLITAGAQGCSVYANGRFQSIPGVSVQVADTVGCGDAFDAAFLFEYLKNGDAFQSAAKANKLGAYVAARPGAIPEYDCAIRRELDVQ